MRTMGKVLLAVTLLATAAQAKDKPAPVTAAAKPVDKDALTIRRLVDGLRQAIKASQAAKEEPDLVALLLNAVAETSMAGVRERHGAELGAAEPNLRRAGGAQGF